MKNKIKQMRALRLKLDADNWQDKKLLARWHKLGAEVALDLGVCLTLFADLDMVNVCAFQGENSFVTFNVESAAPNGSGLQINCQLNVDGVSYPKPRGVKLPGLKYAPYTEN